MKKLPIASLLLIVLAMTHLSAAPLLYPGADRASWVPTDFDPKTQVLLILTSSYTKPNGKDYYAKENKQIDEVMKKNYPYPYELIVDAKSDKYKDYSKYPYLLYFGSNHMEHANTSGGSNGSTVEIFNRKAGKSSATNGWSYGFKKSVLEATIKQMMKILGERKK